MGPGPHIEVLHRLGDVELVHSGDDDGRSGEEEEEDEEDNIDDQAAQPPDEASDGEVLPGKAGERVVLGTPRTSRSSCPPLEPPGPAKPAPAAALCSPVDVLGVGGVRHGPVGDVQGLAAGRGARLPTAGAALALTHIEVLQDAGGGALVTDTGRP